MATRLETDSLGEVEVPEQALYGAQTQRAVENFRGMHRPMPAVFLHCLATVKSAAARANVRCNALTEAQAEALEAAAAEVAAGRHDAEFPVSVFQTGSGTSTNMNMNEVLARLAGKGIHPNDHVNCSQSSNDVIPTTLQVMVATELVNSLLPALDSAGVGIEARASELAGICKTGRTHLMDAMPLTFGQEMGAWAAQLRECRERLTDLLPRVCALPIGGSAIGTGVNVPEGYPEAVVSRLSELTGVPFTTAENRFARMASQDVAVEASACLRGLAIALTKINNDLRWMGSGPLAGLAEVTLEPLQPGSSIMPGKVNPVLPEAVLMVCAEVFGNDVTIAQAGASGNFQLNVMLPLVADKLSSGISLLVGALGATARTVAGLQGESRGPGTHTVSQPCARDSAEYADRLRGGGGDCQAQLCRGAAGAGSRPGMYRYPGGRVARVAGPGPPYRHRVKQLPNILTTLRLLLALPLCWMIVHRQYELVLWLALVAGISDGLDGWLARRLDATTRYGAVMDPLADKLMLSGAYPSMAAVWLIPWWLAILVLGRDLVIVAGALVYHSLYGAYDMEPTQLGKFSTFLQIIFALALLMQQVIPVFPPQALTGLMYTVAAVTLASGMHYVYIWGARAMEQRR